MEREERRQRQGKGKMEREEISSRMNMMILR
jgi:hypothetical protein